MHKRCFRTHTGHPALSLIGLLQSLDVTPSPSITHADQSSEGRDDWTKIAVIAICTRRREKEISRDRHSDRDTDTDIEIETQQTQTQTQT